MNVIKNPVVVNYRSIAVVMLRGGCNASKGLKYYTSHCHGASIPSISYKSITIGLRVCLKLKIL